jgi:hypothetical protein
LRQKRTLAPDVTAADIRSFETVPTVIVRERELFSSPDDPTVQDSLYFGTAPSVEVLVLPKPIEKEILNLEGAVIRRTQDETIKECGLRSHHINVVLLEIKTSAALWR